MTTPTTTPPPPPATPGPCEPTACPFGGPSRCARLVVLLARPVAVEPGEFELPD